MNDETDIPLHPSADEVVEARIVAWVLGEASAFEIAELERLCAEKPELAAFHQRMLALQGLLTESVGQERGDEWKLPEEKAKTLHDAFGEISAEPVVVKAKRPLWKRPQPWIGVAACLAVSTVVWRYNEEKYDGSYGALGTASHEVPASPEEGYLSLERAIRQQEDKVEERRKALSNIVREKGIIYTGEESIFRSGSNNVDDSARSAADAYSKLEQSKVELESQIKSLLQHDVDQSILTASGLDLPENVVKTLYPSYMEVKRDLDAAKRQGSGESQAKVLELSSRAENMRKDLEQGVVNLRDVLRAKHQMTEASLEKMERLNVAQREDATKRRVETQNYAEAKQEFEQDLEVLQKLKLDLVDKRSAARATASTASDIMTGGLRSGNAEITGNNIDAILDAPASTAAPAPVTAAPAVAAKPREPRTRTVPQEPPTSEFKSKDADSSSLSGLTKHDAARRQRAVKDADRLLLEGREAYAKGDYEKAVNLYAKSKERLPDAPDLADRRAEYNLHLSDASVALAQQYRKAGKFTEARALLDGVLAPDLDPNNASAKRELGFLDDPIRTNPALTYEHTEDVDPVRRALYMAEGNYNLGKYDDAKKDYEAALQADPSNSAARRGLERLATAKSDYYRAAYDHTRAELLMEVDKAWELDVPKVEKRQEEMDLFAKATVPDGTPGQRAEVNAAYEVPGQRFSMNLNGNSGVGGGMGYSMADNLSNLGKLENDLKPGEPAADGFAYSLQDEGSKATAGNDMITAGMDPFAPGDSSVAKLSAQESIKPSEEIYLNGQILPLAEAQKGFDSGFDGSVTVKDLSEMGTVALAAKPADFGEIATAQEAFSTFSLNVSDVSFQLALAALERGETPDPAGIKAEQFYNAVDYGDPAPSGDPIAAKIEQSAHPVIPGRNLVRLGVKTASAGRNASQPLHLTLLIDQSGSMVREDRRAALDKALGDLAGLLTEKDRVSVIGFSRTPSLLADGIPGNQLATVTGIMNREAAEAGTNLEEALGLAGQIAVRQMIHESGNRIVLFTDGAANLGDADPARLADKVRDLRQQGVAFDVAGIGADGLNDKLLAELARNGDGRYLFAAGNIANQLAGAFRPAAEDVKVQVRFNPERVSRYKLIGFEEDRLKKEDFRNDAVDAAELSADEAAVALYQVELVPDGKGEIGEMSVRFRDAASGGMVERSWTIAHDENAPAFDRSAPSMQLAGLSMLAAEKLKGGPMAGLVDFNKMNASTAKVRQYYANSSKAADMLRLIGLLRR